MTQAALAKRVGIGQPQIAKLERPGANPSLETLEKVMGALGSRIDLRLVDGPVRQRRNRLLASAKKRMAANDEAFRKLVR